MPTYLYECDVCRKRVEQRRPIDDRDKGVPHLPTNGCWGVLWRVEGEQYKTVRFAEVKGTENGPYARKLLGRVEQNKANRAEFTESQKKLLS